MEGSSWLWVSDFGYTWLFSINYSNLAQSWAMYGFWGIVVLVGMLNRLFTALVQRKMPRTSLDTEASRTRPQVAKPRLSGTRRWIQRNITLPAALGYRHQQPLGWCTIPTRIQSLLVIAFVVINVILCSVTYRAFEGNVLYAHLTLGP